MEKLKHCIKTQLTKAMYAQLDYSPRAEDLPGVVAVMLEDLAYKGLDDSDVDRIAVAFSRWRPTAKRWPRSSDVLDHLPRKSEVGRRALPEPTVSRDEARSNVASIKRMLRGTGIVD